jgi:hypothetical protein
MATFKEAFAAARKEKGAGKTFMYNGKSYSTDYTEEAKGTKPKAKPAGLNPKSGASRSTAGKVAVKESASGASRSTAGKVVPKASMEQQKAAYGANRPATLGSAAKMSQTDRAMADAKAAKVAKDAKAKSKKAVAPTAPAKDTSFSPLKRLSKFIAGGGMTGADQRKKAAEKAEKSRR